MTISYLHYSYPSYWDQWIEESRLLKEENERKRLSSLIKKTEKYAFGPLPLFLAVFVWVIRLLIMRQTGVSEISYFNTLSVSSVFWTVLDFVTIILILLSILYLFFANFTTSVLARSPLRTETIEDYEAYQKLNSKIVLLTFLFALNVGYYAGALIRWAMVTHEYLWLLFFLGLISSGTVIFFSIGFFGIRKGVIASKKERLRGLQDLAKKIKSQYPNLALVEGQDTTSGVEKINPSVILFIDRVEREILLHEGIGEGKIISYSTLAEIIASMVAAVLASYITVLISLILQSF
jgi:hypothetical protein